MDASVLPLRICHRLTNCASSFYLWPSSNFHKRNGLAGLSQAGHKPCKRLQITFGRTAVTLVTSISRPEGKAFSRYEANMFYVQQPQLMLRLLPCDPRC